MSNMIQDLFPTAEPIKFDEIRKGDLICLQVGNEPSINMSIAHTKNSDGEWLDTDLDEVSRVWDDARHYLIHRPGAPVDITFEGAATVLHRGGAQ